jgi:hypothetical protein
VGRITSPFLRPTAPGLAPGKPWDVSLLSWWVGWRVCSSRSLNNIGEDMPILMHGLSPVPSPGLRHGMTAMQRERSLASG